MAQRNYDVEQPATTPLPEHRSSQPEGRRIGSSFSKDISFRSIICALLMFFGICVIILLLTWPWRVKNQFDPNSEFSKRKEESNQQYMKEHFGNEKILKQSQTTISVEVNVTVAPKTETTVFIIPNNDKLKENEKSDNEDEESSEDDYNNAEEDTGSDELRNGSTVSMTRKAEEKEKSSEQTTTKSFNSTTQNRSSSIETLNETSHGVYKTIGGKFERLQMENLTESDNELFEHTSLDNFTTTPSTTLNEKENELDDEVSRQVREVTTERENTDTTIETSTFALEARENERWSGLDDNPSTVIYDKVQKFNKTEEIGGTTTSFISRSTGENSGQVVSETSERGEVMVKAGARNYMGYYFDSRELDNETADSTVEISSTTEVDHEINSTMEVDYESSLITEEASESSTTTEETTENTTTEEASERSSTTEVDYESTPITEVDYESTPITEEDYASSLSTEEASEKSSTMEEPFISKKVTHNKYQRSVDESASEQREIILEEEIEIDSTREIIIITPENVAEDGIELETTSEEYAYNEKIKEEEKYEESLTAIVEDRNEPEKPVEYVTDTLPYETSHSSSSPRYEEPNVHKPIEETHVKYIIETNTTSHYISPSCSSQECKSLTARMWNQMDHSVDPCEHFYDYACGGYKFDSEYEANMKRIYGKLETINERDPVYLKAFRQVYTNCLEFHENYDYVARVNKTKEIFNSVGQLSNSIKGIPSLSELIQNLLFLDSLPLFDIRVDMEKNAKDFIFHINLASNLKPSIFSKRSTVEKDCLRQQSSKLHTNKVYLKKIYEDYLKCLKNNYQKRKVIKALEIFEGFGYLGHESRTETTKGIMEILRYLSEANRTRLSTSRVMKISELKAQYPFLDWCPLLSTLVENFVPCDNNIEIHFYDSYFMGLFKKLDEMPKWVANNVIMAFFADELYTEFVLPLSNEKPEKYCLEQTSGLLKEVSSSIYLNTWSGNDISAAQSQLNKAFAELKTNLEVMIERAEWLDDSSRKSLNLKMKELQVVTDSVIDLSSNKTLKYFESIFNEKDYLNQLFALKRKQRETLYNLWGTDASNPDNRFLFYRTPYDDKPMYVEHLNSIVVPFGMVLNIQKNVPQYINIAQLEYKILREIAQNFVSDGTIYLSSAKNSFDYMRNCGLDQYKDNVKEDNRNNHLYLYELNPYLSLEKRLAEDMALQVVESMINTANISYFSSPFEMFSQVQITFLVLTQNYCQKRHEFDDLVDLFESEYMNPRVLVKSFLENSEKFSTVYQCKAGSGMNHPMKCPRFPNLVKEDYTYNAYNDDYTN